MVNAPPAIWVNMLDYGEIPYSPGGIPANGPIDGPLEDADYTLFARLFWTAVDTGDPTAFLAYEWTAPDLVSLEQGFPGVQIDHWAGGLELFEAVYQHRIQPWNPSGTPTVRRLIETDAQVAFLFKHWSLYHQLITSSAWDVVAHNKHREMLTEAYGDADTATVRGLPLVNQITVVSDRLELEVPSAWFPALPASPTPDAPSDPVAEAQAQACVNSMKCNLVNMPHKDDNNGYFSFSSESGFDCDDFADAMGAGVSKGKPGVKATTVRMTWKKGKGKAAHRITMISAGNKYWLMDGEVGNVSGPHNQGDEINGEPLLAPGPTGKYYPHEPGSVKTGQSDRPIGDRPWVEPAPWYKSNAMKECFQNAVGNPDDYIL